MIVDISALIQEPTLEASLASIAIAHRFVRAASAFALTGKVAYRDELNEAAREHPTIMKRCSILD